MGQCLRKKNILVQNNESQCSNGLPLETTSELLNNQQNPVINNQSETDDSKYIKDLKIQQEALIIQSIQQQNDLQLLTMLTARNGIQIEIKKQNFQFLRVIKDVIFGNE